MHYYKVLHVFIFKTNINTKTKEREVFYRENYNSHPMWGLLFLEIGLLELCNISDLRFEIQTTVQIYTIKRDSKFSVF